jgi:hypothetical protein
VSRWWHVRYDKIAPIEVERATEKFVWIDGRRAGRLGSYCQGYFETWDAARDYLQSDATMKVASLRRQLETANGRLGNIKGMKPPTP